MSTQQENGINLHMGLMLNTFIKKRRIYKSALARKLEKDYSTLTFYLNNKSMQTETLLDFSLALKHNFFADIADLLPKDFTTDANISTKKEEEILSLKRELDIVRAEKEVLLQAIKK